MMDTYNPLQPQDKTASSGWHIWLYYCVPLNYLFDSDSFSEQCYEKLGPGKTDSLITVAQWLTLTLTDDSFISSEQALSELRYL